MSVDKSQFDKPLIDIIDDACNTYPDNICLQFEAEQYTYAELQQGVYSCSRVDDWLWF